MPRLIARNVTRADFANMVECIERSEARRSHAETSMALFVLPR